jgi:hypothetical protein
MATENNPIKAAALAYAERGFRVLEVHTAKNGCCSCKDGFNCKSPGKHPIRNGWQKEPRPSRADIETMFGDDRTPNIGIATGPDSGVFVFDVDPKDDGNESMKALVAEHGGEWPQTYTAKTGSGGWHFYLAYPDFDLGNSAGKLGKGLDTRGKGGFVVAPPSVSGVGPYELKRDIEIADAPGWLLELLRPKERKAPISSVETRQSVAQDIPDAERQRLDGYTKGAIDNEIARLRELTDRGWDGPPWDITTFEVACNLIQLANAPWSSLSVNDALSWFDGHAPRDPGFDDARVMAKWDSALNKVGDNEAAYPPKASDAFWLDAEDVTQEPIDSTSPATTSDMDNFMDDATADDAPEPVTIQPMAEIDGIPVHGGRLVPDYIKMAAAGALGLEYQEREIALMRVLPALEQAPLNQIISEPLTSEDQRGSIDEVDAWIGRNLRSATPSLLWGALGTLLEGDRPDAPVIVFKGGAPILALLARILAPAVGDEPETLLAGPRFSTKEHPDNQIVFEFDDEDIDLMPYADSIVQKAYENAWEVHPVAAELHDELEDLTDYRAAQLSRARLGLGSKPRDREDDF